MLSKGGKMLTISVRSILIFFILVFAMPLQAMAEKKLTVYTVNYPLTYFAERIGGDLVNVVFPAPPDIDPAFWKPDAAAVRKYQKADLIILNGAGYEKWTNKVSLPMMRTVDTSKTFKDNLIHIETNVTHNHGPGGDHSHGGTAFTTWLDFSQAALQAEAIYKAISRKLPERKAAFAKNFELLKKDLLDLDVEMKALSNQKPGVPLLGSHPIYQYMGRRYGLNLKMVMWEPGEDPGAAQWKYLQRLLQEHPATWMIWEEKPLPESSERLKEINILSQVFSPCFCTPKKGDFLSVMQQNINNLGEVLK
jgi:zinc transport system substrate-binding protein